MSRDQRRYLLVIVVLLLAVAAVLFITRGQPLGAGENGHTFVADLDLWQRTEHEIVVTSPYNLSLSGKLSDVPLKLGQWIGQDEPQTNLEVFILLEPEQYVQRNYRLPDGRYVWLSLIGSRKSKSFHSPQICYDTDGWKTEVSSQAVPLAAGEVHALQLVARKEYSPDSIAEHVVLYFYLWPGYARTAQDGMVVVKVTAPIYGSVDETLALEKDFLNHLFTAAK